MEPDKRTTRPTYHKDTLIIDGEPDIHQMPKLDDGWYNLVGLSQNVINIAELIYLKAKAGDYLADKAIISPTLALSYGELFLNATRVASVLKDEYRLIPGNRVAFLISNGMWEAVAILASWMIGAVAIMLPDHNNLPVSNYLDDIDPQVYVTSDSIKSRPDLSLNRSISSRTVTIGDLQKACYQRPIKDLGSGALFFAPTSPKDPALIIFTSGSTGLPKATIHYHRELAVSAYTFSSNNAPIARGDLVWGTAPLYSAYGLNVLLVSPLLLGGMCLLLGSREPLRALVALQKYSVSHIYSSPSGYQALLPVANSLRVPSLKLCISAGEQLSRALIDNWFRLVGVAIVNGFGCSETFAFFMASPPLLLSSANHCNIVVGYRNNGVRAVSGEPFKLMLFGPTGCKYFRNEEEQRKRVCQGATVIDDLFTKISDNEFRFVGRSSDIFIKNGYNISCIEVENSYNSCSLVSSSCAVPVFNEAHHTNTISIFVEPSSRVETDETIIAIIKRFSLEVVSRHLRADNIYLVSSLERLGNGKINRNFYRSEQVVETGLD